MSSNPNDDGFNNKTPNNDNKHKKSSIDNSSLKSETSSITRPLKFGSNEESNETEKINEDQINNNLNINETVTEETAGTIQRSSRFPTLRQCTNESQDEATPCCANLAFNLYNKALESAKRALPKNKQRPQFPRSFGEDFESLGPDGFHYLDDAQTECSYDYKDIEFNRDSIFRPESIAQTEGIPIIIPEISEPLDFQSMRDRYGLPENADRVQKYDPKKAETPSLNPIKVDLNLNEKEFKKKPEKPKRSEIKAEEQPKEQPKDSKIYCVNIDSNEIASDCNSIESGVILRTKSQPKSLKPPEIEIEICDDVCVGTDKRPSAVELMANRTSQLIIDNAIEAVLEMKFESDLKKDSKDKNFGEKTFQKLSIESDKEMKKQKKDFEKQKKELEKLKKEEEKRRKKIEKIDKTFEKKEKKRLFNRFKTEDKQKKEIMKKQKEFEKMKQKKEKEKQKSHSSDDRQVIEENEVFENQEELPYEDIDRNVNELNDENCDKTNIKTIPTLRIESVLTEEDPKAENIKDVEIACFSTEDGIENENYIEEHEEDMPQKSGKKKKTKKERHSFRLPNMDSFRTKVKEIFPKKQPKEEKYSETRNEIEISSDVKLDESETEVQIITSTEKKVVFDDTEQQKSNVMSKPEPIALHEYENVIETPEEVRKAVPVMPEIVLQEVAFNEFITDDEDKDFKDQILISTQNTKNKKKKKSKTKAKLDRFKAKAIESLPRISSIRTRVKDLLPKREPQDRRDLEYERFISDHDNYNQRMRYHESDGEAVSDSELCDSLHRSTAYGRQHVYEEMAATQERLDAYMTPISGPLRPPRRFSSLKSGQKVCSVPALSTQVLIKPKRIPPPRPPPPRPPPPKIVPTVEIFVDQNPVQTRDEFNRNLEIVENNTNSMKRKSKQRVPANIYYNNIRLSYKPKRRFVNLKSRHQLLVYDRPKSPVSVKNGKKLTKSQSNRRIYEKNNRNLNQKFNTMPQMDIKYIVNNFKSEDDLNYPKYEDIELRSRAPRPPPRRRRKANRSQTLDALYWRPFSWKYRRCRSMTELDVRRKQDMKPNYENIKTIIKPPPPRPPPPSGSKLSLKSNKNADNYHLYASVHKGLQTKVDISKRPLPPPPVPPRPKCMSSNTPSIGSINSTLSQAPVTRDVSVSTKDNGLIQVCEKETQIDIESQLSRDLNGNLEPTEIHTNRAETPTDRSLTPTNRALTPTTPTTPTNIWPSDLVPKISDFDQKPIAELPAELSESTVTLSSMTTTTSNWFDAEDPDPEVDEEWDEETINDDISSIASNYQSVASDVTLVSEYASAATPEHPIPPSGQKSGKRSQSTRHRAGEVSPRPPRRSLPENQFRKLEANEEDNDDSDELLGLARDLQSELKQILERRSKLPQRPDSTNSSNASLHEPIDSSSDGDDYSLTSATEQSPEFFKRKQQQKLFFIAKELYSSEEVFVDVLHLLNCDFRNAVAIQLPEEVLTSILKLLPQLQQINEQLLSELKSRVDNWANNPRISDVLVKICPFLKQYSIYIRDFETISANYDDALRRYPPFAVAVKEFESTPRCQKLSVKHFMLKPVQRLPQYRLLLQDYLRHLTEDSEDYLDTINALNIVSQVAEHANNTMKLGDNVSKLLSIQNSIVGGNEIIKPGRMFVKEGELMKLSRKGMQERWFILFNDSFMYLTPVQNGVYRVNHELSLTGMRVSLPSQQDFQNEFSVISHTRSFSLAARSTHEREQWVSALNKAIQENANKRISFAKASHTDDISSTLQLGNCAPVWIPDARVTMCQLCTSEFSVTFRRHHCRCCGKVVCSACSANKAPLPYLKNRNARVCDECYNKLREQLEQIEKQVAECGASSGEVGTSDTEDGWSLNAWRQQFARNLPRSSNRKIKTRYVPSVLKEVCANDKGSLISGYLHKRESKRNWKSYWFVIKDLVLYTYKASEDVAALKSLPLLGFKVEALKDSVDGIEPKSLFQLSHPGQPSIIFRAETIGSAERWFKAMAEATTLE